MKNHTPPRMLGRVGDEQWEKWQAAARQLGWTFTEFAKRCLDMYSEIITTEPSPRRKLPQKIKRKAKK